jgi:hypothetical protein
MRRQLRRVSDAQGYPVAHPYVWRDPARVSAARLAELEAHDRRAAELETRTPDSTRAPASDNDDA